MHNTNSIVLATADILCMVKKMFPDILLRYIAIKLGFISTRYLKTLEIFTQPSKLTFDPKIMSVKS